MDCDAEVGGLHTDPDAEDLRIVHRPHATAKLHTPTDLQNLLVTSHVCMQLPDFFDLCLLAKSCRDSIIALADKFHIRSAEVLNASVFTIIDSGYIFV